MMKLPNTKIPSSIITFKLSDKAMPSNAFLHFVNIKMSIIPSPNIALANSLYNT